MTEDPKSEPRLLADSDEVASLLRLAGPREAVPADRERRVKAAVHAAWRHHGRARARRKLMAWSASAVAAAALLLVGVRVVQHEDPGTPVLPAVLATVEVTGGPAPLMTSGLGVAPVPLQRGDRIREGDGVDTTGGGPAALRMAGGASVRIDRGTRLRLLSDITMALDQGTIYVDSGKPAGGRPLEVRTPLGVARDVGTRFEVRVSGSGLRVRVRDGLVRLAPSSRQSHDAGPGVELTLDAEGHVGRRMVPVYGPDWAWAAALARPFDLEGQSVHSFVTWIAEENGWQVRFADAPVERKAQTTTVHGSIQGLTPGEALSAVLPTSGLRHHLDNGVLEIRLVVGGLKD